MSVTQTLSVQVRGLIHRDLGTSTAYVSWVTTGPLLSAAVVMPLLGRFGGRHGKKPTPVAVLVAVIGRLGPRVPTARASAGRARRARTAFQLRPWGRPLPIR